MRGRPRRAHERDRAIFDAYQSGRKVRELAEEYGVSTQRVHQIAAREAGCVGVPLRPSAAKGPQGPKTVIDPMLAEAYRTGSMTPEEIAAAMGVSRRTMHGRMRAHAVPRCRPAPLRQRAYELFKEGRTLEEVAMLLGVSRGAASVLITRARKQDPEPYFRSRGRRPKGGVK